MNDEINEIILKAHARSFKRAFETAVRTGTALVFVRGDEIIEINPPFRYEMVPLKEPKKKSSKPARHKKK